MPWDSGLTTFTSDISGPVATAAGTLGLAGMGIMLIFGREEMNGILKGVIYFICAMGMLIGGAKFLSALSLSGAVIF
jgi:type IV secretion system protein VirB2